MNSLISLSVLKKKRSLLILVAAIVFVMAVSLLCLTTRPRLWIDEAKSIELAKNFLENGHLEIESAPSIVSGTPHLLQSTGYPLTIPLAGIFKIFGVGPVQARLFMLLLMLSCLILIWLIGKHWFGKEKAAWAVLLIATFASFHDSGRTVVGEIPGFMFLLIGLYAYLEKKNYFLTGLSLGLAVVTKPSVYLWVIPIIGLIFVLEKQDFWKKTIQSAIGALIPAIVWTMVVLPQPFSIEAWQEIISFYKNPYISSTTVTSSPSLLSLLASTTLLYFGVLIVGLIIAKRSFLEDQKKKSLFYFVLIYSALAFIYYLRSPGWLRYLLGGELLILFLTPQIIEGVLHRLSQKFSQWFLDKKYLAMNLIYFGLVAIQTIHFFTSAQIYSGKEALEVSQFVNKTYPQATVGVVNNLNTAVWLISKNRYQIVEMLGIPSIGKDPRLLNPLPEIIIGTHDETLFKEREDIISEKYREIYTSGNLSVYLKKAN